MLSTKRNEAPEEPTPASRRSTWVFLGKRTLPADPVARRLEQRGRRWLLVSYVLCPCHLPVTLGLLAVAFGGTAAGTAVVGHAGWVAAALTALYGAVLWQGFRRIRAAKRLEAQGLEIDCSTGSCAVRPSNR